YFERDLARGLFGSVGPNLSGLNKLAFRFQVGNYAASVNSGTVSTSLDNVSWTTPSSLSLGTGSVVPYGGRMINGPLSRLTYWPTRLPNSLLQTITQ
ncbi:MAG: hypothetical protein WD512_19220, partial [Candidatus Paceibacterota bacterium]